MSGCNKPGCIALGGHKVFGQPTIRDWRREVSELECGCIEDLDDDYGIDTTECCYPALLHAAEVVVERSETLYGPNSEFMLVPRERFDALSREVERAKTLESDATTPTPHIGGAE